MIEYRVVFPADQDASLREDWVQRGGQVLTAKPFIDKGEVLRAKKSIDRQFLEALLTTQDPVVEEKAKAAYTTLLNDVLHERNRPTSLFPSSELDAPRFRKAMEELYRETIEIYFGAVDSKSAGRKTIHPGRIRELALSYGLDGQIGRTQKEVGQLMGRKTGGAVTEHNGYTRFSIVLCLQKQGLVVQESLIPRHEFWSTRKVSVDKEP